jgi:hypothetical protein
MAVDRYISTMSNYVHPQESNLLNIHKAMEYLDDGKPALRVKSNIQGDITITGEVTIPGTISVTSTPEDPVHIHLTEVGTSGILDVPYLPIGGTVTITNTSFAITNFPTTSTVYQGTIPWVTTITNWPALQYVNGTLYAVQSGTWSVGVTGSVTVTNFTSTVNVASLPAITGTVVVSNFTSTVHVDNFPTSVTVTNFTSTVFVSNTVTVSNTSFAVTNFPTTSTVYQGTSPWTITGTVNIGTMPEVEIKNDVGNPVPISGNVTATITGTPAVSFGGTNLDAFGRLRVSNPFTLFDGALRYRDDEFRWNQVDTGAGTSVFQPNESTMLMTVSGNGDSAVRQSKQVFSYQPGKSLLTMATFVMNTPTTGLRQRVGYFGAQNGVYFEVDGTTVNLVIRKYTSGSVDDTTEKIPQSLWNGDKLLGTGASGITLDVTHSQIFWCDVEWLGVGSVRAGFVINGQFIVCHTFHHANIFDKVYMTTASLPVRYELTSTGAAGTMRAICSTVISEGGYSNRSQSRAIGTSLTGKNLSQAAYRPLVCIRLKSANIDSIVVPTKFDLYGLQQAAFGYRIILNPTLTDASWTSAGSNSSVEYDLSATALTGGTVIDEGIFVGSNKGGTASVSGNDVDFSNQLGRTIAGVSDIWCLAAIATTNNDDAVASVTWQEHQ